MKCVGGVCVVRGVCPCENCALWSVPVRGVYCGMWL